MRSEYWNAVKTGNVGRVAGFLIEDPTLVGAADEHGKTAYPDEWAEEGGHSHLVDFLRARR